MAWSPATAPVPAMTAHAAMLLGTEVVSASLCHGGDLSRVIRIGLACGGTVIAKTGPAPRVEAAMLRAIAAAGAPAPAVLAVDDQLLVLECLADTGRPDDAWGALGRALATLHACRGDGYGWPDDYAFGPLAIVNQMSRAGHPASSDPDWPGFWAACRLAVHLPALDPPLARRIERLIASLHDRLPAHPPAALLHGDLWGGNILVANGRITGLIDPACYHGAAEVDIAMLGLFNTPTPAFFEAYGPPAPGHDQRLAIYRLWPALVHLRLFGAGYRPMVTGLLDRLGV